MFEIYFLLVFCCWFGVFSIVICEQSKFEIAKHIETVYACKWMQIYTISEMLHWTFYMHTIMLSHIKIKTTSTIIVRASWREEICGPGAYYILKDLNFIILFWLNTAEQSYIYSYIQTPSQTALWYGWAATYPTGMGSHSMQISLWNKLHYTRRIEREFWTLSSTKLTRKGIRA